MSFLVSLFGYLLHLKKAKKYGKVLVALTTDIEVKKFKGYLPELNFKSERTIRTIVDDESFNSGLISTTPDR